MHAQLAWGRSAPPRKPRVVGTVACAAAVVLVHAWLLSDSPRSRDVAAPGRARVLEVRQLQPPMAVAPPLPTPPPKAQGRVMASTRPALVRTTGLPHSGREAPLPPQQADAAAVGAQVDTAATDTAAAAWVPTRVPPPAQLTYSLQRGAAVGEARLSWQVDGERYTLHLQGLMPSGRDVDQHSEGGFDASGLAPLRLADRRNGRDVRAANFQRERGLVTFSGPRWALPLSAGTQDRLSWLVQLVAVASGAPDGLRNGSELALWVVGVRGAASLWRFEVRGGQRVATPSGEADTLWLVREPAHPYDVRIEVWLDPTRGHWPVRVRQTQVPGGEPLQWTLRDEPLPPPGP